MGWIRRWQRRALTLTSALSLTGSVLTAVPITVANAADGSTQITVKNICVSQTDGITAASNCNFASAQSAVSVTAEDPLTAADVDNATSNSGKLSFAGLYYKAADNKGAVAVQSAKLAEDGSYLITPVGAPAGVAIKVEKGADATPPGQFEARYSAMDSANKAQVTYVSAVGTNGVFTGANIASDGTGIYNKGEIVYFFYEGPRNSKITAENGTLELVNDVSTADQSKQYWAFKFTDGQTTAKVTAAKTTATNVAVAVPYDKRRYYADLASGSGQSIIDTNGDVTVSAGTANSKDRWNTQQGGNQTFTVKSTLATTKGVPGNTTTDDGGKGTPLGVRGVYNHFIRTIQMVPLDTSKWGADGLSNGDTSPFEGVFRDNSNVLESANLGYPDFEGRKQGEDWDTYKSRLEVYFNQLKQKKTYSYTSGPLAGVEFSVQYTDIFPVTQATSHQCTAEPVASLKITEPGNLLDSNQLGYCLNVTVTKSPVSDLTISLGVFKDQSHATVTGAGTSYSTAYDELFVANDGSHGVTINQTYPGYQGQERNAFILGSDTASTNVFGSMGGFLNPINVSGTVTLGDSRTAKVEARNSGNSIAAEQYAFKGGWHRVSPLIDGFYFNARTASIALNGVNNSEKIYLGFGIKDGYKKDGLTITDGASPVSNPTISSLTTLTNATRGATLVNMWKYDTGLTVADFREANSNPDYSNGRLRSFKVTAQPDEFTVHVKNADGTADTQTLPFKPAESTLIDVSALPAPTKAGYKFTGWKLSYTRNYVNGDTGTESIQVSDVFNAANPVIDMNTAVTARTWTDSTTSATFKFNTEYLDRRFNRSDGAKLIDNITLTPQFTTETAAEKTTLYSIVQQYGSSNTVNETLTVPAFPGAKLVFDDRYQSITKDPTTYQLDTTGDIKELTSPVLTTATNLVMHYAEPSSALTSVTPTWTKDGGVEVATTGATTGATVTCTAPKSSSASAGETTNTSVTKTAIAPNNPSFTAADNVAAGEVSCTQQESGKGVSSAKTGALAARPATPTITKLIATATDKATLTATTETGAVYNAGTSTDDKAVTVGAGTETQEVPVSAGETVKVYNKTTAAGYSAAARATMIAAPTVTNAVRANTNDKLTVTVNRGTSGADKAICTLLPLPTDEATKPVTAEANYDSTSGPVTVSFTTGVSAAITGVYCVSQKTTDNVLVQSWKTDATVNQQLDSPTLVANAYLQKITIADTETAKSASYATTAKSSSGSTVTDGLYSFTATFLQPAMEVTGTVYADTAGTNTSTSASTTVTIPAKPTSVTSIIENGVQKIKVSGLPAGASAVCYDPTTKAEKVTLTGETGKTELVKELPAGTTGTLDCVTLVTSGTSGNNKAYSPATSITLPPVIPDNAVKRDDNKVTFTVANAPAAGESVQVKDNAGNLLCTITSPNTSCEYTDTDGAKFGDATADPVKFVAVDSKGNSSEPTEGTVPGKLTAPELTKLDHTGTQPKMTVTAPAGATVQIKKGDTWVTLGAVPANGTELTLDVPADLQDLVNSGDTVTLRSINADETSISKTSAVQLPGEGTIAGWYTDKTGVQQSNTKPTRKFDGTVNYVPTAGSANQQDKTATIACRSGASGEFTDVASASNATMTGVPVSGTLQCITKVGGLTSEIFKVPAPTYATVTALEGQSGEDDNTIKFVGSNSQPYRPAGDAKVHISYVCNNETKNDVKDATAWAAYRIPACGDQQVTSVKIYVENANDNNDDSSEQIVNIKPPLQSTIDITKVVQYGTDTPKISGKITPSPEDTGLNSPYNLQWKIGGVLKNIQEGVSEPTFKDVPSTTAGAEKLPAGMKVAVRILDDKNWRTSSKLAEVTIPELADPTAKIALRDKSVKLTFADIPNTTVRCYVDGADTTEPFSGQTSESGKGVVTVTGAAGKAIHCQRVDQTGGKWIESPFITVPATDNLAAPSVNGDVTRDVDNAAATIDKNNTVPTNVCYQIGDAEPVCTDKASLDPADLTMTPGSASETSVKYWVEDANGNQSEEKTLTIPAKVTATATVTSLTRTVDGTDAETHGQSSIEVAVTDGAAGQQVILVDQAGKEISSKAITQDSLNTVTFTGIEADKYPAGYNFSVRVANSDKTSLGTIATPNETVTATPDVTKYTAVSRGADVLLTGVKANEYCQIVGGTAVTPAANATSVLVPGAVGNDIFCYTMDANEKIWSPLSSAIKHDTSIAKPTVTEASRDGDTGFLTVTKPAAGLTTYATFTDPNTNSQVVAKVDPTTGQLVDRTTGAAITLPTDEAIPVKVYNQDATGNQSAPVDATIPAKNTDTATITKVDQSGAQPVVSGTVTGKDDAKPVSNQVELVDPETGKVVATVPVKEDGTWTTAGLTGNDAKAVADLVAAGKTIKAVPVTVTDATEDKPATKSYGTPDSESIPATPEIQKTESTADGGALVTVNPGNITGAEGQQVPDTHPLRCRIAADPNATPAVEVGEWVAGTSPIYVADAAGKKVECQAYQDAENGKPALESPVSTAADVKDLDAAPKAFAERLDATTAQVTAEKPAAAGAKNVLRVTDKAGNVWEIPFSAGTDNGDSQTLKLPDALKDAVLFKDATPDDENTPAVPDALTDLKLDSAEVVTVDKNGNDSAPAKTPIPEVNTDTAVIDGVDRSGATPVVSGTVTPAAGGEKPVSNQVELVDATGKVVATVPVKEDGTWTTAGLTGDAAKAVADLVAAGKEFKAVPVATASDGSKSYGKSDAETVPATPVIGDMHVTENGDAVVTVTPGKIKDAEGNEIADPNPMRCRVAGTPGWTLVPVGGGTVTLAGAEGKQVDCQAYVAEDGVDASKPENQVTTSPVATSKDAVADRLEAPVASSVVQPDGDIVVTAEKPAAGKHNVLRFEGKDGKTYEIPFSGGTNPGDKETLTLPDDFSKLAEIPGAPKALADIDPKTLRVVTIDDSTKNESEPTAVAPAEPVSNNVTIDSLDRTNPTSPVVGGTSEAPFVEVLDADGNSIGIAEVKDGKWSLPVPADKAAAFDSGKTFQVRNLDAKTPTSVGEPVSATVPETPVLGKITVTPEDTAVIPINEGKTLPAGSSYQCRITDTDPAGDWTDLGSTSPLHFDGAAGHAVECRVVNGGLTGPAAAGNAPQLPKPVESVQVNANVDPAQATLGKFAKGETPVITVNGKVLEAGKDYTATEPDANGDVQVVFKNTPLAGGDRVDVQRQTADGLSPAVTRYVPNDPTGLKAVTAKDGSVTVSGHVDPLPEGAPAQVIAIVPEDGADPLYVTVNPDGSFSHTFPAGIIKPKTDIEVRTEIGMAADENGKGTAVPGVERQIGLPKKVSVPEKPEPVAEVGATTGQAEPNTQVRITYMTAEGPKSVMADVNENGEYTADLPGQIPGTSITTVTVRPDGSESAPVESLAPLAAPTVPVDSANGAKGGVGSISGPAGDATAVAINYINKNGERVTSPDISVVNGTYTMSAGDVMPGTPVRIVGKKGDIAASETVKLAPVKIEEFTAPANGEEGFISGVAATGATVEIRYQTVSGEWKTFTVTAENNSFSHAIPTDAAPGTKVFARAVAYEGTEYEASDDAEVEVPEVAPSQPIEVVHEPSSSDQARCVATSTDKIDLKWIIAGIGVLAAVGGIVWANSHGLIPSGSADAQSSLPGAAGGDDNDDQGNGGEDRDRAAGSSIQLPRIELPQIQLPQLPLPQLPQLPDLSRIAPIGLGAALIALLLWNTNQCSSS